jgi:polyisoprenoid-binding protein YceI
MKTTLGTLVAVTALAGAALAVEQTFDFKDPKGVNNATFQIDAPLESTSGSAGGISGAVSFDPDQPAATHGKIVVAAASLHVPNPVMQGHLHGGQWLDVAKYPEITFEATKLTNVKTDSGKIQAEAVGTLTIKGVSKEMTVPVTLTYLKDKLGLRVPNQKGDLLVIRANFIINRSDFGINPNAPKDKVSDEINLTLSIAGAAPRL